MGRLVKILHLDPDFKITYLIYREGSSIRTSVPLRTAITLLQNEDFDLILSEPHNKAILKKQPSSLLPKPLWSGVQPVMADNHGAVRGIRSKRNP